MWTSACEKWWYLTSLRISDNEVTKTLTIYLQNNFSNKSYKNIGHLMHFVKGSEEKQRMTELNYLGYFALTEKTRSFIHLKVDRWTFIILNLFYQRLILWNRMLVYILFRDCFQKIWIGSILFLVDLPYLNLVHTSPWSEQNLVLMWKVSPIWLIKKRYTATSDIQANSQTDFKVVSSWF